MKTIKSTFFLAILFMCCEFACIQRTQARGVDDNENKDLGNALGISALRSDSIQVVNPLLDPTDSIKTEQLYLVVKNNGIEYVCKILSDDGREVLIFTDKLGKIYIPKSEIRSIEKIKDEKSIVRGEYYDSGPFITRYSFTTNALPMKRGANYALINLYGPDVHFALSDNFSLGILTTWIGSPFVVVAKYSMKTKNEKINYSVGTLFGSSSYVNSFRGFGGLHFVNVTFGDAKKNITFAGGYAYLKPGTYSDKPGTYFIDYSTYNGTLPRIPKPVTSGPIFSIGGITKVGVKASFIFDSMIGIFSSHRTQTETTFVGNLNKQVISTVPTQSVAMFLMPGMRFQTTDNKAFQISLAGVSIIHIKGSEDSQKSHTSPIPMCTWFYKF